MQKLTVHTSRTYDVLMEEGLLSSAADYIAEVLPPLPEGSAAKRKCCVVCDRTVYELYGKTESLCSKDCWRPVMRWVITLFLPARAARL